MDNKKRRLIDLLNDPAFTDQEGEDEYDTYGLHRAPEKDENEDEEDELHG